AIQPSLIFSVTPLVWALLAILGISGWSLLLRVVSKAHNDYQAVGGISEWLSLILVFASMAALGSSFAQPAGGFDWSAVPALGWLAMLGSALCYSGFMYLSYKAYQTVEASERSVINQLQIGWTVFLSVLLLSERLGWGQALGAALIVAGALACTYEKGHRRWKASGVQLLAAASIFAGTASLFDKVGVQHFPPLVYAIPQYGLPAAIMMFLMGKDAVPRMLKVWKAHRGVLLATAVFSILSFVAYLLALQQLPVSEVVPLINLNVIVGVLGGILLLGEKKGWPQKILGAILAFAGAWLIVG
ncbi:MAG: EamA family transporter, partial [Candidatus Micrarchaeota archaeon]|nr:EamA family transporter [Candidatus Micrarchaeota archaeon]